MSIDTSIPIEINQGTIETIIKWAIDNGLTELEYFIAHPHRVQKCLLVNLSFPLAREDDLKVVHFRTGDAMRGRLFVSSLRPGERFRTYWHAQAAIWTRKPDDQNT